MTYQPHQSEDATLKVAVAVNTDQQLLLLSAEEELALAKASPQGAWLSPKAQALYEEEGRRRFAQFHRRLGVGEER